MARVQSIADVIVILRITHSVIHTGPATPAQFSAPEKLLADSAGAATRFQTTCRGATPDDNDVG
ncbi:MAG: hypothetical protein V3U55_04730 [Mycobacterium sp.]